MPYVVVLTAHSWLRWAALLLGMVSTICAYQDRSMLSERPRGARWDAWWMAAVDLQVLLGLLLYLGLSPVTRDALNNLGAAVRSPTLRFWTVDHAVLMLATVALLRLGRIFALTAKTASARRTRRLACFALALVSMAAGVPWPGSPQGRPLFRAPAVSHARAAGVRPRSEGCGARLVIQPPRRETAQREAAVNHVWLLLGNRPEIDCATVNGQRLLGLPVVSHVEGV